MRSCVVERMAESVPTLLDEVEVTRTVLPVGMHAVAEVHDRRLRVFVALGVPVCPCHGVDSARSA